MDRPTRAAWYQMLHRCEDPDDPGYKNYGGRGITVCPEWHEYQVFADWILVNLGPRPPGMTLNRVDNDGPYAPGNVEWADMRTQRLNSRPGAGAKSDAMKAYWARKKALYPQRW